MKKVPNTAAPSVRVLVIPSSRVGGTRTAVLPCHCAAALAEMILEEQEREKQKRLLLGLPSESEADDGDLDDAIRATVDRIQYLLRKATAKSGKLETTVTAVVASIRGMSPPPKPRWVSL